MRGELYRFVPVKGVQESLKVYKSRAKTSELVDVLIKPRLLVVDETDGLWWMVHCDSWRGWTLIAPGMENIIMERVTEYKRYEEWKGNNYFLLGGLVMLGKDVCWFLFTNGLVLLPSVYVMCVALPKHFPGEYHCMNLVLGTILAFSFVNLYMAALVDPGIIPRRPMSSEPVLEKGQVVDEYGYKLCTTCNIYRPPRAKHCSHCNNCVEQFDHHCPWTGNCVGLRNYHYFFRFLVSITLYIAVVVLVCLSILIEIDVRERGDRDPLQRILATLTSDVPVVLICMLCAVCSVSVWTLCMYHMYLQSIGETTNENLRRVWVGRLNPYDRGCLSNLWTTCVPKYHASKLPNFFDKISAEEFIALNEPIEQVKVSTRVANKVMTVAQSIGAVGSGACSFVGSPIGSKVTHNNLGDDDRDSSRENTSENTPLISPIRKGYQSIV